MIPANIANHSERPPPGCRLLALRDRDAVVIVVPPHREWRVVLPLGAGIGLCVLALSLLPWHVYGRLQSGSALLTATDAAPMIWIASCFLSGLCQLFVGITALNRRIDFTVQGDELQVRRTGLWRESRRQWHRARIGRIYVEPLGRRTAALCIQVVGLTLLSFEGASVQEWEWAAALLRDALQQAGARHADGHKP